MIEEVRFRTGKQIEVVTENQHFFLNQTVNHENIMTILQKLTNYSVSAFEEELKKGYFTMEGGHRVGVVGHLSQGLGTLSDISGLNVRLAHECIGCGEEIARLIKRRDSIFHTLFLSPPGIGKTTFLRDTIRVLSNEGYRVGVADERSEIGASFQGQPQNDLGICTDVLDNCNKSEGMMMLLRSMSPQIIAVDEMGGTEDVKAVKKMLYAGVRLLGTVHAGDMEELLERRDTRELLQEGAIERVVVLKKVNGRRRYKIYDAKNNRELSCSGEHMWTMGKKKMPYFLQNTLDTGNSGEIKALSIDL